MPGPIIATLTRIGTVEGFGGMIRHSAIPDMPRLRHDDLMVITADHGNDPTTPSTDHSREHVPLIATGAMVRAAVDLGTRATFADLGQTVAEIFGTRIAAGESFLRALR